MCTWLFNDRTSLKKQHIALIVSVILAIFPLVIIFGFLLPWKADISLAASYNLQNLASENSLALAKELASSINQQLLIIGESVCMVSANYASILMDYADYGSGGSTILNAVYSI